VYHGCTLSAWLGAASQIHIIFIKPIFPGTQLALLLFSKVVKSEEMEFAIFFSTENSVLRAVARVSSGTLNKEAAAFNVPGFWLLRAERYVAFSVPKLISK